MIELINLWFLQINCCLIVYKYLQNDFLTEWMARYTRCLGVKVYFHIYLFILYFQGVRLLEYLINHIDKNIPFSIPY